MRFGRSIKYRPLRGAWVVVHQALDGERPPSIFCDATNRQAHRTDADFMFHLSIAQGSLNPYFVTAMQALGPITGFRTLTATSLFTLRAPCCLSPTNRVGSPAVGVSPSGKAPVFGTGIPRFES